MPPPAQTPVPTQSPFDLILPFLALAAILFPLRWMQGWLLRHLFGFGYLVSKDKRFATLIFYFVLFPGVVLHEISRYLVAGMLRIIPTGFQIIPEEQDDGEIEIGFVQFGLILNPLYAAIVDLTPLAVGLAVTSLVSSSILNLPDFISHLRSFDIYLISDAFARLVNRPDFLLWSYVLFAVANTMLPSRNEYRGLLIFAGICGLIVLFFVVLGLPNAVYYLLNNPVRNLLLGMTAIFGIILFVDIAAAGVLWLLERIASRVTRREVQYAPAQQNKAVKEERQPTDIYELALPIPPAPGKVPPRTKTTVTVERPAQPALGSPLDRRGLPAGDLQYRPDSQPSSDEDESSVTPDAPLRTPPRPEPAATPRFQNQPAPSGSPAQGSNLPVPSGGNFPKPTPGFGAPRPAPKPVGSPGSLSNAPRNPTPFGEDDEVEDADVVE